MRGLKRPTNDRSDLAQLIVSFRSLSEDIALAALVPRFKLERLNVCRCRENSALDLDPQHLREIFRLLLSVFIAPSVASVPRAHRVMRISLTTILRTWPYCCPRRCVPLRSARRQRKIFWRICLWRKHIYIPIYTGNLFSQAPARDITFWRSIRLHRHYEDIRILLLRSCVFWSSISFSSDTIANSQSTMK